MKHFRFVFVLLACIVMASCGTQNKFASSFGKRRYTKGFYADVPGNIKPTGAKETVRNVKTQAAVITETDKSEQPDMKLVAVPEVAVANVATHAKAKLGKLQQKVLQPAVASIMDIKSHHVSNSQSDTHSTGQLSNISLGIFAVSLLFIIIGILSSISSPSTLIFLFEAGLVGDLVAFIMALVALGMHEDNPTGAGIVIGANVVLLLLYLLLAARI